MLFLFFNFTPLYGHNRKNTNLQTFSQILQKKVCRGRLSTNFDPRLEPVDVKNLKNSIFCQRGPVQQFFIKEGTEKKNHLV